MSMTQTINDLEEVEELKSQLDSDELEIEPESKPEPNESNAQNIYNFIIDHLEAVLPDKANSNDIKLDSHVLGKVLQDVECLLLKYGFRTQNRPDANIIQKAVYYAALPVGMFYGFTHGLVARIPGSRFLERGFNDGFSIGQYQEIKAIQKANQYANRLSNKFIKDLQTRPCPDTTTNSTFAEV